MDQTREALFRVLAEVAVLGEVMRHPDGLMTSRAYAMCSITRRM